MYKIIEVKQSVFEDNNKDANKLREECKDKGVFLLNIELTHSNECGLFFI